MKKIKSPFKKDIPIGQLFTYKGVIYQPVLAEIPDNSRCEKCAFECDFGNEGLCVPVMYCSSSSRRDKNVVVYQEITEII